jgi:hypothetical protein
MLRVDKRAKFVVEGAWFWKLYRFRAGKLAAKTRVKPRRFAELGALQREQPVPLILDGGRQWWWFRDCFYWEDEGLDAHDVMALVMDRERRKQRQLDRAHAALRQEADGMPRREVIPVEIRKAVFDRDGGAASSAGATSTSSTTT